MQLTSPVFDPNSMIPPRYTCDAENENPPLTITGVPEGTRSLAIIMHDPDAVSGDFVHWVLWNLNPEINEIKSGSLPEGAIEGRNSAREAGYTGPCPPTGSGIHHYIFVLSALDIKIDLPSSTTTREDLLKAMAGHELATAELVGLYQRGEEEEKGTP